MNLLLWICRSLQHSCMERRALSKAFTLDKISEGVPAFSALPRKVWKTLGILERILQPFDGYVAHQCGLHRDLFCPDCDAGSCGSGSNSGLPPKLRKLPLLWGS
jgi:hypothetical protein